MATIETFQLKVVVNDKELVKLTEGVSDVEKSAALYMPNPPGIATPGVLTQKTLGVFPRLGLYCS